MTRRFHEAFLSFIAHHRSWHTDMSTTSIPQNACDSTRTSDNPVAPISMASMAYRRANTIREGMLEVAQIDRDIQELEGKLCTLRLRRNLVVPISLLPPEILLQFFLCLRAVDIPSRRTRSLGWIRVTHVCHLWRTLALRTPMLWAEVIVTLRRGTIEHLLRRAAGVPLFVRGFYATNLDLPDVRALASRMSQIRVLDVEGDRQDLALPLLDQISASATQLEVLKLRTRMPTHLVIEGGLHPCTRPVLRHLSLQNTLLDWNSLHQLSSLVSLELIEAYSVDRPSEPMYQLPLSKLISILASSPRLESLTLRGYLIQGAVESSDNSTPTYAVLHHLSKLDITFNLLDCLALLKRIRIPSGAAILLHRLTPWNDAGCLQTLLNILKAHVLPPEDGLYLGIEVLPLNLVGLAMRGLTSASASFYASFHFIDGKLPRTLPVLLASLPLTQVTSFELQDFSSHVRSKHWHQMLDAAVFLPHVRNMLIRGHNCRPFLGLLGRCAQIAPALETLQLRFGSRSAYDVLTNSVLDEICKFVSCGLSLKRLELQSDASHPAISDWETKEELTSVIPEIRFVQVSLTSYDPSTPSLTWGS
ncbi:hypothetical protein DENSPDRAFT_928624 [Dentipellis sp. KUC8613]|nr:hypothetical protein DENSPDRAFT_928624 [Dentipellis sp. KUC8613]